MAKNSYAITHVVLLLPTDMCRVLESIKAGRRLPESRFSPLKLAAKSQNSVVGMLRTKQDQG